MVPARVNLAALLSRLRRICRVFIRSAVIVPTSDAAVHRERVVVLLHQRLDRVEQLVDHRADLEGLERDRHLARFDLREIEDAVDQLEQVLAGRLDALEIGDEALAAPDPRRLPAAARCRG